VVQPAADLESQISGLKILLVDDSSDNRTLILAYLKNIRSRIDIAENGLIATQMFPQEKYDLVLMDVEMPVMDGYQATREIRSMESVSGAKPTPIFALTAHAFADMAVQGYEAGFTSLLTKPIRKATLLEAIAGNTAPPPDPEPAKSEGTAFIVMVEEGMEDVVPGYLEKRRAEVEVYRTALASSDFDTIKKLAHKMKGTGTGYGIPRLTELGAGMEKAALAGDSVSLATQLDEFALYVNAIQLENAPGLR